MPIAFHREMTLIAYTFAKPMKIRFGLFLFDKPIKCFAFLLRSAYTFIFQGHLNSLNFVVKRCIIIRQENELTRH